MPRQHEDTELDSARARPFKVDHAKKPAHLKRAGMCGIEFGAIVLVGGRGVGSGAEGVGSGDRGPRT